MKSLLVIALTFTIVSLSSCSSFKQDELNSRSIASVTSPLSLDQLLSIQSTSQINTQINTIAFLQNKKYQNITTEFIPDPKMPAGTAFKIVLAVENQMYKFKFLYAQDAQYDVDAAEELNRFMYQLTQKKFPSHFSSFELYFNANAGDFLSLQTIAKLRAAAFEDKDPEVFQANNFFSRSADKINYWRGMLEKFEHAERLYNKQIKILDTERRKVMDALDKATNDKQFRTLVAKNDRIGAANLIRQYLPWEHMPPFERLFWENHLSIMADPLPLEDRVLIYRGIDDDLIQVAQENEKELTKTEALQDQKIFLMSTIMTKNQGTWNRRLRSLTAMYEKFMGTDDVGVSEFTKSARITNMFFKHAKQPAGSPFLSYTPKIDIAYDFGSSRLTAYFIDPRMIYFNYASSYAVESEFLLPITSFPDDLAAVYDMEIHKNINFNEIKKLLKEKSMEKLSLGLGKEKAITAYQQIEANSEKYFKPVMGAINGPVKTNQAKQPDGKIMTFFKQIFGIPTKKAAEIIDENSNVSCLDLIQLFWK